MRYTQAVTTVLLVIFLVCGVYSAYWLENIEHNGQSAFNSNKGYKVWRNVRDYGAKGDGVTDDTGAIQAAIIAGGRCGEGCGSSTLTPGVVYFPSGTYLISASLIQYYYTQFVGDAINPPTLLAAASMRGYLIQSDPYGSGGNNWYTNQDNFYRQVRNFVIDLTRCDPNVNVVAIHWQVAQATSVTNVVVHMSTEPNNQHQGLWMENGSGGFMSDLVFNGGKNALWIGNQQFTTRNITINGAATGIYMNWNWGWTFKTLSINACQIGVDMTAGKPSAQGVSSIVLLDGHFTNTKTAILSNTDQNSQPAAAGTLLIDNIRFTNVQSIVATSSGHTVVPGSRNTITVASWGQGHYYNPSSNGAFYQGALPAPSKPSALLGSNGYFFERPRPQYAGYSTSQIVNVVSNGAKGDGNTDDTAALQRIISGNVGKVIYFPQGVYIITNTIDIPAGSRLTGEVWSTLSAQGGNFGDANNPRVMLRVGKPGSVGVAELSDLLFSTRGPAPGAILIEWNLRGSSAGESGMWDCHYRIGGAAGTDLRYPACSAGSLPKASCMGAFLLLHITRTASVYLENVWAWTADHDLDSNGQVSIYSGRGILVESENGPVWMYGTASEHNVMYQYSIVNSKNVFMGMIQTETPYYQSSPKAPQPYAYRADYKDPRFNCPGSSSTCAMAWGSRFENSSAVFVYGAGHYSFFNNYEQTCLTSEHCQDSIVEINTNPTNNRLYIYNLNTKAAQNSVVANGKTEVSESDNRSTFCSTILADLKHA